MPPTIEQQILVKIKAVIDGIGNVRELGKTLKDLTSTKLGGQSGEFDKLSTTLNKLSSSVQKLSDNTKKVDNSKFASLVRVLVGLNAVVQTLASVSAAVEGFNKIVDFFKSTPALAEKAKAGFSVVAGAVVSFGSALRAKFASAAREAERASGDVARGVTRGAGLIESAAVRVNAVLSSLEKRFTSVRAKATGLFGGGGASKAASKAGSAAASAASAVEAEATTVGGGVASVSSNLAALGSGVAEKAAEGLASVTARVSALGPELAALGPIALAVVAALTAVVGVVALLAAGVASLAVAVGLGVVALFKIAPAGIAANSQLEQVQLGIAAVITSLAELKVGGVPVEGAEKFSAAMTVAADQVQKLRVDAINTTATFEQIAPAFQAALAPGLAARLTLDQIRQITVQIVQGAASIGLPLDQVSQEVRAILEGSIDVNARLAQALGITNEDIKAWKKKGTLAEELNKRLKGFTIAGIAAAQTVEGLKSNLQEALNVFNQAATTNAFAALKDELKNLLSQIFDFKNAGLQESFKTLASLIDDILTRAVRLGGGVVQSIIDGLKRISEFVQNNRVLIDGILNEASLLLSLIFAIGKTILSAVASSETWGTTLLAVKSILSGINVIFAAFLVLLNQAVPLLQLVITAANLAIIASNAPFLRAAAPSAVEAEAAAKGIFAGQRAASSLVAGITTVKTPPPTGGKKGGGGRQSQERELTRAFNEAKIEATLARLQAKAERVRQEIETSVDAIKQGLEDNITSISEAFRLEGALADKALRNELDRISAERKAARERRDLTVANLDPKLNAKERQLAIDAEDKKFVTEITKLDGERNKLIEERVAKTAQSIRDEAAAQKQLADTMADIENQFDSQSLSNTTRAAARARELDAQVAGTRKRLLAEINAIPTDANREAQRAAQEALDQLDDTIKRLKATFSFEEAQKDIQRIFEQLRAEESRLNDEVEHGQISVRDALKKRIELEAEAKKHVIEYLTALKEAAAITKDPAEREALKQIIHEWENLGKVIDENARRIDDTIRHGLEDTLTDIITKTKSVGEAFRALAITILNEIARILAVKFVEKLFGGLLNTGSGNSIGNILVKILGVGVSGGSGGGGRGGQTGGGGSIFDSLPGVIKNFQTGAVGGLRDVNTSTKGVGNITFQGFGQMIGLTGQGVGLLGQLVGIERGKVAAGIAKQIFDTIAKAAASSGGKAEGGHIEGPGTETSDSILARLSRGEFVIRALAARRIGLPLLKFLNKFGRLPFGLVPDLPRFAFGGDVGDIASLVSPPITRDGDGAIHLTQHFSISTPNPAAFKASEAQMKRDIARAAQEGIRRAKSRSNK